MTPQSTSLSQPASAAHKAASASSPSVSGPAGLTLYTILASRAARHSPAAVDLGNQRPARRNRRRGYSESVLGGVFCVLMIAASMALTAAFTLCWLRGGR